MSNFFKSRDGVIRQLTDLGKGGLLKSWLHRLRTHGASGSLELEADF